MTATFELIVSAGPGPAEAQRFASMLADALRNEFVSLSVLVTRGQAPGASSAEVILRVGEAGRAHAERLVGGHLLVAELRGPRQRRRWFAAVGIRDSRPMTRLDARDVDVEFLRSRGPGGQNVNKRETAVRLTHRPTGIAVLCDRHRHQARNRADGYDALQCKVAEHRHLDLRTQNVASWRANRSTRTRTPRRTWRLDPNNSDAIVPK